jgi:hypothetical protein
MAKMNDKEIDEILSKQKPGFRRVKPVTAEKQMVLPERGTPDLATLQKKAVDIAEGSVSRGLSGSDAGDDTSRLLRRFLGEDASADAIRNEAVETDAKSPAADIDIVQVRPVDSDAEGGPVRPSVVISRSTKKIIAETG